VILGELFSRIAMQYNNSINNAMGKGWPFIWSDNGNSGILYSYYMV
jgi:hypothetical protein